MLCLLQFVAPVYGQNKKAELTNEKKKLEQEIAQQRALLKKTQKSKNASLREIQLIKSTASKGRSKPTAGKSPNWKTGSKC